jgi:hypothetical protein
MACCIGSHQIAPNSGTNRHQNRHQSYAHFSQSHPPDFRSDRDDFETKTGTRTQRILALWATRNRHQDFVKPLSNLYETGTQPAPPLLRDFCPTDSALKNTVCGPLDWDIQSSVYASILRAVQGADLHQLQLIASHWRLEPSPCRICNFRSRRPRSLLSSLQHPQPRVLVKVPCRPYQHSRSPARSWFVF